MPILLALIILCFPRLFLLWLKFFTGWFSAVHLHLAWQILGFIFVPFTLLWYTAVAHWYGGHWDLPQKIILVIAILLDLGGGAGALRRRA